MKMNYFYRLAMRLAASSLMLVLLGVTAHAEPLVPGTGVRLTKVGDDFEEEDWSFVHRMPKSSEEIDGALRGPTGRSKNGRWYEGAKRGQPDYIVRVETPEGGLAGSTHALMLRTLNSGVPGRYSYKMEQDDFVCDVNYRLRGSIPVWQEPSVVTRIYMPPIEEWENRTGCHFAFRLACTVTTTERESAGLFGSRNVTKSEPYWPGLFIDYTSASDSKEDYPTVRFRVRANGRGGDFRGPYITQTGWWTMGMSVTRDGMVHYYAKPGIDDLTPEDHLYSGFPYSFRAEYFKTFFFCVCNKYDGKTWSAPWIVDDSFVYVKNSR